MAPFLFIHMLEQVEITLNIIACLTFLATVILSYWLAVTEADYDHEWFLIAYYSLFAFFIMSSLAWCIIYMILFVYNHHV